MPVDPKKAMPLEKIYEGIFSKGFMSEDVVCVECGKKHTPDSEEFFTIIGNMTIGLYGGIIGNNFDSDGRLFRVHYCCRNPTCSLKFITRFI
jgi:hypothetical protein